MCIEKCIRGKIIDIVVSIVPRKYAILAGYKVVMHQRPVCTGFINSCTRASHSCRGIYNYHTISKNFYFDYALEQLLNGR